MLHALIDNLSLPDLSNAMYKKGRYLSTYIKDSANGLRTTFVQQTEP